MESMVEILSEHASAQPNQIFAADAAGKEYTYKEAFKWVKIVAANLLNQFGIKENDCVMVECNQQVDYLVVNFACELIGAIFVPVEDGASAERKNTICSETESVLWVYCSSERIDSIKSVRCSELFTEGDSLEEFTLPDGDSIAQILYTTGTTGTSKGIVISNKANVALAENIKYGVGMKPGNTELIPLPISHSHGLRCCYANLLNGGTIVLMDGLMRVKEAFRLIEKYKITAMDISPSAAALLIKLSKGAFWEYGRNLDYIQIGTAALPENIKEQLLSELTDVHLYNFYGSTESGRSCVLDFSTNKGMQNCIGKPTKNSTIVFTDDDRNIIEATKENPGLLASSGIMNMDCYWKNKELTEEILKDGYIYTNDLGYMDENGYVFVLGRKDDVINYNGIKIAPDEIEEAAKKYEGVADAACVPLKDALAGQVPKLFVQLSEDTDFDMKGLNAFLTKHLDANKIPKRVEIIDKVPRTYNGKIQRKKLVD